jgi:D-beta-D-heptose 7-phosphate kinase/D-beta-D-heptose 1-phosphate adenosyltransferase
MGGKADVSIICISGGFSVLHCGHIRLIKAAAEYGDAMVILNSDDWLQRKYGRIVVPYDQRAEVLAAIKGVLDVVPVDDSDGTVCKTLALLKPDYFANGGDRTAENTPELRLCTELGIRPLFGIGGGKVASSSKIMAAVQFNDW